MPQLDIEMEKSDSVGSISIFTQLNSFNTGRPTNNQTIMTT